MKKHYFYLHQQWIGKLPSFFSGFGIGILVLNRSYKESNSNMKSGVINIPNG